jgi:putative ABC transport system substrate-binding protein
MMPAWLSNICSPGFALKRGERADSERGTIMWLVIKRLSLGVTLILLMSGVLLVSDWSQRKAGAGRVPRVAVLQYSSQPVLMECVEGVLNGFSQSGFVAGQTITIQQYNAEGDMATVNMIARQITTGEFDMVVTISTPAMQAMANANREGKVVHVFGLVGDPFGAGVGINRDDPLDHPKHLVGFATLVPVIDVFRVARALFPGLKSVGVVWNAGESNSQLYTQKAREASRELGINLIEATVENSSAVAEAVSSVISRGVQAIWVGGDNTVLLALDSVIAAARKARIPVFTVSPTDPRRGTLFDLGANFHELGRMTGELAVQVLRGTDPAAIPIAEVAPQKLVINTLALNGLKDAWRVPDEILARADIVVDQAGVHKKAER